ncbi:DUF488 domain-containing protein [Brevibacterium sp. XM4083]|uniref:DUF488 domain-containing protein n=1 Tax=Brevibacterium sp. XM4083 TaxID=2583238 RepID=UPI00112BBFF1|nr:DUF488 domain-containing protein [Brevibacterium sp. XM4083]MCM1013295.1 DUF488 domain-containing protein [Brevibacterium sp. XM4083]
MTADEPDREPARTGPASVPDFLTIGHSNRSLEEFIDLLRDSGAEVVVDVRKLPGSNANPQFNEDVLGDALAAVGIELRRLDGLTGRRLVSRDVPFTVNAWWENRSFHNYADHALGTEFAADIAVLLDWGDERRCAVMCSEAVWWRCHRRIIADYLLAHDREVLHVLGPGQTAEAVLSSGAVIEGAPGSGADFVTPGDREDSTDVRITYPEQ